MAEVLLFHHVQGQTAGMRDFADRLRDAGHTVHAPDLFDGRTFPSIDEGMAHVRELGGFAEVAGRGVRAAERLPEGLVYAGFSLGVVPAQQLAQTRPGAKGAVLLHGAIPPSEFGGEWPPAVPLQVHIMDRDEFALEGDLDVARELDRTVESAELFLYPGDRHLFTDSSLAEYDRGATELVIDRVLEFLGRGS